MRWRHNERAGCLPDVLPHHPRRIAAIANGYSGEFIYQFRHLLDIVLISAGKDDTAQPSLCVYGGMKFESIMLALVVFAEFGNVFHYFMGIGPYQLANFQHSGIHESDGRISREKLFQDN